MRTFFSDKPGAKFLNGCKVTLHVMPDYVEYIVKLDHGYYGVVNLMPEGINKVSLLCFWGRLFQTLTEYSKQKQDNGYSGKALSYTCASVVFSR